MSSVARQAAAAADQAGDPARAAELARLALAEAGTPEQRAQAGITLAPLLTPLVTGLEDQEVTVAEAALADAAGEAELTARARFVLGRALLLAGRFAEAVPVADQAAAQARELGMADESLGARATAYFARRQLGEQDAAEEAALTAAATGGESVETALWVLTRMADWWWPADPARGEPIALAAHTLAVDQGVRASIRGAWARETLTLCRWLTGHWDDVDELAATDPLAVNDPTAGAVALECEVDIARGRLDLARRRLQLAEKVTTDALSRTFVAIVTADLCLAERDPATAAALCLAGIADPPPETGFADFETILVSRAVAALADARDAGDDVERAAAVLAAADRVEQRLAERPNPRLSAIPQSALRAHGSRLDGGGDPDLWRQAIELRTGQPYEIAKCRYQLAKALLAAGDTATADRELDLAADACRELGAVVLLDRITALR